ncbi:aldo/keto reductase [Amycolatopsis mediterranei]|uniref:aldo/keto reductase n=1 Tax=Amycolatopsis mediterranei TaxID=33910 RepID=UPI003418D8FE
MKYSTFGRSGLRVADYFLGTMTFGEDWGWGTPLDECRRIFEAYAEAGGNVIDTANAYTNGASERITGELLGKERDRFILSTKYTITSDGRDPNAAGNHRLNLRRSLEESLTRLNTDRIDLYWVHAWDPHTPIEETMRALDDAVSAGKVLYVGISDAPAWVVARGNTLAELRGWSPFVGLQLQYNLVCRDIERELLPMADHLGLATAAWSPLAAGVLSGKFSRGAHSGPSRTDSSTIPERHLETARAVDAVADDLGVSSAQVALAWTRAHRPSVHPIIGARRIEQLTDNLAAADLTLPADAVRRLDEVSAIDLGFPYAFLEETREFVFGAVDKLVRR